MSVISKIHIHIHICFLGMFILLTEIDSYQAKVLFVFIYVGFLVVLGVFFLEVDGEEGGANEIVTRRVSLVSRAYNYIYAS